MATVVHNVRRLRGYAEANGAFATDHTGTLGDFFDIRHIEDSFEAMYIRPLETPLINQQHLDGYPGMVFGPKSATAKWQSPLSALASRATGAATETSLGKLFGIAMGGTFAGTGTTVNDGSATTTEIDLTSAAGFREGGAVGFATGTGGALELREIATISSNTITLKHALTNAPSNGVAAYGCVTYYLDNLAGDGVKSLQLITEGLDNNDRWVSLGGQISAPFSFDFNPGTIIPKVGWEWLFANYIQGEAAATDLTASSISDQALSSAGINAVFDSKLMVHNVGNTTTNTIDAQEISFAPQISYVPHKSPAGVNTIVQWVRARNPNGAMTGSFTLPHDADTWFDHRDAQTARALYYQIGSSTTGGACMISAPNIVVSDFQRDAVDGLASQRLNWVARLDTSTSTNSNALQRSAFRIHMA